MSVSQTVIAVSQRVEMLPSRDETRDALDQRIGRWLHALGALPFPVPNALSLEPSALESWLATIEPGAIVLSGGGDVGDCAARDEAERQLLSYARERKLPLLGICRGMQTLAVWLGGQLQRVEGHVRSRHRLQGRITDEVNSFHNVGLAGCPPDCEVLAWAEDGGIEAFRHTSLPWQGWMWHPEREPEFTQSDLKRAQMLVRGANCTK